MCVILLDAVSFESGTGFDLSTASSPHMISTIGPNSGLWLQFFTFFVSVWLLDAVRDVRVSSIHCPAGHHTHWGSSSLPLKRSLM